jgi:hypothetical protein
MYNIKVEASCIGSQAMVDCGSPHIYAALLPRTSIQVLLPFLPQQPTLANTNYTTVIHLGNIFSHDPSYK